MKNTLILKTILSAMIIGCIGFAGIASACSLTLVAQNSTCRDVKALKTQLKREFGGPVSRSGNILYVGTGLPCNITANTFGVSTKFNRGSHVDDQLAIRIDVINSRLTKKFLRINGLRVLAPIVKGTEVEHAGGRLVIS